jgi:hypothetical protein
MSPINDELRAALHGRASTIAPSPDPLADIERRAKRIRRNRIGAAVAASALAVSVIALAVPALQSAVSSGPNVPNFATAAPSEDYTADNALYALDPKNPWRYRGADLELLGPGTLDTIAREFGIKHGTNDVELNPLFGQVWEPSRKFELFFLAKVDGSYRWGVSETPNDAGPEWLLDETLTPPGMALAAPLEGDAGGRLVVVADPHIDAIKYSADDTPETFSPMQKLSAGVATVFLGDGSGDDFYTLLDRSGKEVYRSDAPDAVSAPDGPEDGGSSPAALDPASPWSVRGDRSLVTNGQLDALVKTRAGRHQANESDLELARCTCSGLTLTQASRSTT